MVIADLYQKMSVINMWQGTARPRYIYIMYLSKEAVDAFGEKLDPGGRVSLSRQQLSELREATDVSHHHCALESIHARY